MPGDVYSLALFLHAGLAKLPASRFSGEAAANILVLAIIFLTAKQVFLLFCGINTFVGLQGSLQFIVVFVVFKRGQASSIFFNLKGGQKKRCTEKIFFGCRC